MSEAAITQLLNCAASVCERQGSRLTTLRRDVLRLVIDGDRPAGAYDLLQRFSLTHGRTAPPTIYRALDFLVAAGLVHKVERLSAYIACTHHLSHDHAHPPHGQAVQFLICTGCGTVLELEDDATREALTAAAGRAGFVPHRITIEAEGLCAACAEAPDVPPGLAHSIRPYAGGDEPCQRPDPL